MKAVAQSRIALAAELRLRPLVRKSRSLETRDALQFCGRPIRIGGGGASVRGGKRIRRIMREETCGFFPLLLLFQRRISLLGKVWVRTMGQAPRVNQKVSELCGERACGQENLWRSGGPQPRASRPDCRPRCTTQRHLNQQKRPTKKRATGTSSSAGAPKAKKKIGKETQPPASPPSHQCGLPCGEDANDTAVGSRDYV